MLSVLSERQRAIVETVSMRLHTKEALSYLKDLGYEMGESTYYRYKKKIQEMKLERMQHIALYFQDQHLERIDKCELIEKLMWENYRKGDMNRVKILESIISIQPFLSAYYDATRYVMESKCKTDIMKTPQTYVSIDVNKEIEAEREKEQFDLYHKRQLETIAENNKPIVIDKLPAIGDDDEEPLVILPKPNIKTNFEQRPVDSPSTPIDE